MDRESSDTPKQTDSTESEQQEQPTTEPRLLPRDSSDRSGAHASDNGTNETYILPAAYVTEHYGLGASAPAAGIATGAHADTDTNTDAANTDAAAGAADAGAGAADAAAADIATETTTTIADSDAVDSDAADSDAADAEAVSAARAETTPAAIDTSATSERDVASDVQPAPHAFDEDTPVASTSLATNIDASGSLINTNERGIIVTHLTRSFGKAKILRDVSFTALPGRITALVGPNGAGKTTLLLILASLLQPTSGSVQIAGVDPTAQPKAARPLIGWMPDTIGIWPNLTARQSLRAIGAFYGMGHSQAKQRADELLRAVGLFDLASKPTRVLSRGQRQRLSFARSLVHDPAVLILDEPMSGLDPEARVEMRTILRRLADDGKTILLSSHVLAELEEFTDDAIYLADGTSITSSAMDAMSTQRSVWVIESLDQSVAVQRLSELKVPYTLRHDKLLVEVDDPPQAAAVLRRLVDAGVDVVGYRPEHGNLEKNLLQLATTSSSQEQEDAQ